MGESLYGWLKHNFILGSVDGASEVSLHPPHLIDSKGILTPAALIPFCAYQTNMKVLGQKFPSFPVCSQFKPTVLHGQLCYSLNLSSIGTKSKSGKSSGLMLIIDQGSAEEETRVDRNSLESEDSFENIDLHGAGEGTNSARIYLNTLASFTDYRAGSYAMTVLKKMTGTDSFLKQNDEAKNCQIQTIEECQTSRYIDAVKKKCGCVPWTLNSALTPQVRQLFFFKVRYN